MTEPIGELFLENGKPLLKMWAITVDMRVRPYVKHSHSRFEITVVTGGSGEYTTDHAVYPMEVGDVFVFSSNEQHSITKTGENGLSIVNLHFEPRYLEFDNTLSGMTDFVNFCFSHSNEFRNRIPAESAGFIRTNHQNIKAEFLKGDKSYPVAIKAYLQLILIDLLRNHHYRNETTEDGKMIALLSVYDYIEQHLSEEITLKALADLVSLSPNYFSHVFKKINGISLWEYINTKRIERASRLIIKNDGSLTMLDIATRCGFNNTANFNKAFKKQKGITPTELLHHPEFIFH